MVHDGLREARELIQRGLEHYARGRLREAVLVWQEAATVAPKDPRARSLLAFARARVRERDTRPAPQVARDTLESPIPGFLASLTVVEADERTSDGDHQPSSEGEWGRVDTRRVLAGTSEIAAHEAGQGARDAADTWKEIPIQDDDMGTLKGFAPPFGTPAATPIPSLPPSGTSGPAPSPPHPLATLAPSRSASPCPPAMVRGEQSSPPPHATKLRAGARGLVDECKAALKEGRAESAALAAELALQLGEQGGSSGVDGIVDSMRSLFERAFCACIGDMKYAPIRAIPSEELAAHGFDHRAAFLMSRMDGMLSVGELLDIAGMPRFDALRLMASLRRAQAVDMVPI